MGCVVGCGNNNKNSPDRILYSFSIKNVSLSWSNGKNGLKQCVVRSKLLRIITLLLVFFHIYHMLSSNQSCTLFLNFIFKMKIIHNL